MVLNTLSIDPRRTWKGPWRWFHEEMLDCCHPLSKVREEGITLEQVRRRGVQHLFPFSVLSRTQGRLQKGLLVA